MFHYRIFRPGSFLILFDIVLIDWLFEFPSLFTVQTRGYLSRAVISKLGKWMTVANLSFLQLCFLLLAKVLYFAILNLLITEHIMIELLWTTPSLSEIGGGIGWIQIFLHIVPSLGQYHWTECALLKLLLSYLLLHVLNCLLFSLSLNLTLVVETDVPLGLLTKVKSLFIFGINVVFLMMIDLT